MDKRGNISSRNMRLFAAIMTLIEALVLISLAGCAGKKVDYGTDTEKLTKSAVCNVKDFSTDETYSDEFSVQTEIGNVNIRFKKSWLWRKKLFTVRIFYVFGYLFNCNI